MLSNRESKRFNVIFLTKKSANRLVFELYKSQGHPLFADGKIYRAPELFSEEVRAAVLSVDNREVMFSDEIVTYNVLKPVDFLI
jgi:hypothetical protein